MNFKVVPLKSIYISQLASYWENLSPDALKSMGVDEDKLPSTENFKSSISTQLSLPNTEKKAFAMIGLLDNKPIGHCNLNPIYYGDFGKLHLHLWSSEYRGKGFGYKMVKQSLPYFFSSFQLDYIISEPFAKNIAPNKTLSKVGFELVKNYITIPGSINFEQEVNQWKIVINQDL